MNSNLLPEDVDRDFTASIFIVEEGKVLLLNHAKAGKWIQPGGHIEENELPHEAALRETEEETGIEVNLVQEEEDKYQEQSKDLPQPFNVNLHKIKDNHWHCDFSFLGKIENRSEPTHSEEHNGTKWFSREELKNENLETFENVRKTALKAIEEMKK